MKMDHHILFNSMVLPVVHSSVHINVHRAAPSSLRPSLRAPVPQARQVAAGLLAAGVIMWSPGQALGASLEGSRSQQPAEVATIAGKPSFTSLTS